MNLYLNVNECEIDSKYFVESPGNILRYLQVLNFNFTDLKKDIDDLIMNLIERYKLKKENIVFSFITFLIEIYYSSLSFNNKIPEIYYNDSFNVFFFNRN